MALQVKIASAIAVAREEFLTALDPDPWERHYKMVTAIAAARRVQRERGPCHGGQVKSHMGPQIPDLCSQCGIAGGKEHRYYLPIPHDYSNERDQTKLSIPSYYSWIKYVDIIEQI